MDNMIEVKKHALQQLQTGEWKATFTIQAIDMPSYLLNEAMGKRYYIVFVDADDYDEREGVKPDVAIPISEQAEGDKLRTRAVMLCKDAKFQEYMNTAVPSSVKGLPSETEVAWWIKGVCNIKSRSELVYNIDAQLKFRELLHRYKDWQFENNYSENLSR